MKAIAAMLITCLASAPARAEAPASGTQTRPEGARFNQEATLAMAQKWVEALRTNDLTSLAIHTHFPFRFDTTHVEKSCEGLAATNSQLRSMVKCIRKDKVFVEELQRASDLDYSIITATSIDVRLRKLTKTFGSETRLVKTFINGDGITIVMVLVVSPSVHNGTDMGVSGFLRHDELTE